MKIFLLLSCFLFANLFEIAHAQIQCLAQISVCISPYTHPLSESVRVWLQRSTLSFDIWLMNQLTSLFKPSSNSFASFMISPPHSLMSTLIIFFFKPASEMRTIICFDCISYSFFLFVLQAYPGSGYSGISGTVVVSAFNSNSTDLTISYSLSGLPVNITAGIHFHTGDPCLTFISTPMSILSSFFKLSCAGTGACVNSTAVGGHFFNASSDPWNTTYTSAADGTSTGPFDYYPPKHRS